MEDKQILFANGCGLSFMEEQPEMKVNLLINTSCRAAYLVVIARTIIISMIMICSAIDIKAQCSGNIYDSGGSGGNYGNNENITTVLDATANKVMSITFNSFDTESGYDIFYIYDGPTTSDPLLGSYSGTSLPPDFTSSGQFLTLLFISDSNIKRPGYSITLSCIDQEICADGLDNDGDGWVDSFDPDCPSYAPFDCNKTLYQSNSPDNGITYLLDTILSNPVSFNNLYNLSSSGMSASSFNSLAFNPIDRFIYGMNPLKTGNYELYRINNIGDVQYIGNVTGLTGTNDAGCMAADGKYYVSGVSGKLFEINTSTLVATQIVDLGFEGGDMAINPVDGLIYIWSTDTNQLYSINPTTGASSAIGSPNTQYLEFGSMFFNEQGDIIAFGNDVNISATGQETLVKINSSTGVVSTIGTGAEIAENDGCSCAFGVGMTKTASSSAVDPGDPLTYTITIHNRTGQTLSNVTFEDVLPVGLTYSSNPYNVTGLSLGSPSIIGTGNANFVISSIPTGSSNSFDLDITIPINFCDDIYNQARLLSLDTEFGSIVLSDDPNTVDINDPTVTIVENCEEYWLESECEVVGANWNVVFDVTASRDNYATISPGFNSLSTPPTGVDDRIRFNVTITNAGDYSVFGRVHGPNSNDDSFWVRANGGTWYKWNGLASFASVGWEWGQVYNSDAGNAIVTFPLVAGANTIDFAYREDGTLLDKIKVALSDELPTGEGGISQNCPEICGNGEDDDGDGLTDCADDDCNGEVFCQGPCDPGKLFVERWLGVPGSTVTDLTSDPNYPNSPSELDYITLFQGPNNYADNYGTRVRGFIIPSESGTYSFNVTGDDNTILYLSTDVDEVNKSEIASVTGWSGVTEHNKYPIQTSAGIELKAGVWYYVELLFKEGTGGDHFQVYWKTPSVPSTWNIIPGGNLAPYICPEICDNGDDDDGDGLTDCLDPDCGNGVNVFITSVDNIICLGETAVLNAESSGSLGLLTYAWSGGAGTSQVANVSPATTTTYTVTVTNTSGCQATDQMQVTVNPLPNAGATNDGVISCTNTSVLLTATPAGLTYVWSGGGTGQTKSVTSGGTYTVTVTDGNGCFDTASTIVSDDLTPPTANAGIDQSICIGESANLTASGGGTYEWDDSSTSNSRTVSPVVTTDYTITVTAANGCTDVDIVRVVVNPLPNPSITKDGDIKCDDLSVQLTALPAGLNYVWSTTETSQIINVTSSGTYSVVVTDANGCSNNTQIVVDEYLAPTPIFCERYRIRESGVWGSWINFSGVCEIEFCEDDGLKDIEIDGGPDLNTGWVWKDEDDNTNGEVSEIVVFNDIDLTDAGNYTAEYTNAYGCVSNISINVIVNANPVASSSNNGPITCNLPTVTMTALPAGMTYLWQGGGTGQTKNVTSPGVYSVTVTNSNGCTDISSTTVLEDTTPPIANAGIDQDICFGESTILTVSGGYTYLWSNGLGTTASVNVSPIVTTTYSVTVTAANGCIDTDNIIVTVNPLPVVICQYEITGQALVHGDCDVELCEENGLTLSADPNYMASYDWTGPNGFTGAGNNLGRILISNSLDVSDSGDYTVIVTDLNGCTASNTISVIVNPLPVASASNDGPITCNLPTVTMTALPAGMTYVWQGGGTGQTKNVTSPGTYSVTVTNSNGCADISSTTVLEDTTPPIANAGLDQDICLGESTTLTVSGGGTYVWSSGLGTTASVNVSPIVTTFYTVTVTATNGCIDEDTIVVTVNSLPVASASNNGPIDCNLPSVTMTALPTGMTYLWQGGGTGQTKVISATGTYSVTVTDANGCWAIDSTTVTDDLIPPLADAGADELICEGDTVILTASGGATYSWSHGAGNTAAVAVSPIVTTTYTVTVTAANGCQDTDDITVDVDSKPIVSITGSDTICIQTSTTLSPSTGGTWQSSDNSIAIVSNSGVVFGLNPGTVSFIFTSSATGCVSDTTANVTITPDLSLAVDYIGGICLNDDTQLSAIVTGGTMEFTYSWTGPSGFTASTQVIDVNESGTYYITVTDVGGCTDETSGYIYGQYDPFIFTLNSEVCEDEDVTLSVNSATAVSYQWGANAGNATTQSVVVSPGLPSEDYFVTVTNDIGCTTEATVHIDVKAKTPVTLSGGDEICIGETTTLTPATGGVWTSSNNTIAGVTNDGTVTGLAAGTVTFIFLDTTSNCESDLTAPVTIHGKPSVSVVGPDSICEGETTTLSPSTGGTWTSNNPLLATVTNGGVVTALDEGSVSFIFTNSTTGCASEATEAITINPVQSTTYTGPTSVCLGDNTYLSPTSGGTWVSSDTTVATVTNIGVVTTVGPGSATFTFTSDYSCISGATLPLTVIDLDLITISGNSDLCEDEIITLTASSPGGTWSSSNNTIATVNSSGQVTGIAYGDVTITYTHDPSKCEIDPTFVLTIKEKPTVYVSGPIEICAGETTSVSTSGTGGIWSSSDETIAIVDNLGTVVGMSAGLVTFSYTDANGCESDATVSVTVNPAVIVDISIIGSACLTENSKLAAVATGGTPNFTYSWSGPGGFVSSLDTVDVPLSGLYNVLVTDDAGCSSNKTAYIYESYDPFIFALNTEICEGEDVTLSVNGSGGGSYLWSANAGSATTQSVTVTPPVPGDTYYVTITSTQGCSIVANSTISVDQIPIANLTGGDSICVGDMTTLSPTTGGIWSSSDYGVASVTNYGDVYGLGAGGVNFTFRDTSTGCYSAPTTNVAISANENIIINGDNDICMGISEVLTASVAGGTWSSSNPGIATVSPTGELTPIATGNTDIIYTPIANTCYNVAIQSITVNNIPSVAVNGPSTICEGEMTYLIPSNGGVWVSDDVSVATVLNIGTVTGLSGGTASFTFTSDAGCVQTLSTPITVVDNPIISLTGPSSICKNGTTTLSPTTGGIWLSSNNVVATVNSSGMILGINPGIAEFTFTEFVNGCISSDVISVTVNGAPTISGLGDNNICIGSTTSITPNSGGVWISSNPAVATITSAGIITGVSSGAASFTFTDSFTGCVSVASSALTVDGNPSINITGETDLCVGENSSILPSSGGTWSSSDVSIGTITSGGIITAISAGDVTFIFTSDNTGCSSIPSDTFSVNNPTNASITGPSSMCIGSVETLVGSESGTWESSNQAIATVNNAGVVTANGPGIATITLNTSASCITNPTIEIQIDPNPNPVFTGPTSICLGFATTLSPTSGGTWTSSDNTIATVDNAGNVTSVSSGIVEFTFINSITGCSSTTTNSLNIYDKPDISISGSNAICIGENTNMEPSSGGIWASSDTGVATISTNGLVTGISAGNVTFTFTETGTSCVSAPSAPVTILPKPVVSITGSSNFCIGNITTLSPSTGGSWISSMESVATVTDQGIVTGVGPGIAKFTFTSDEGCSSNQTSPIIVNGTPTVTIDGPSEICVGDIVQMLPSSGGLWVSSDTLVATIENDGTVSSLLSGSATFTYTDSSTGCVSNASEILTVNPIPNTGINGPSNICIGTNTNFTPSTGGVWSSVNPTIASIENNGEVTGISPGNTKFIFTQLATGCVSDSTVSVSVASVATPVFVGDEIICIGDTSSILPNIGGTWVSTNSNVATITNSGIITGVGQGTAKFRFINSTTGCISTFSSSLTVNGSATVFVNGEDVICAGSQTNLIPNTNGSWSSLNPGVATVTSNGVVTGVSVGTANFVFADSITGCNSNGLLSVAVQESSPIIITGNTEVCIGYTIQLTPTSGGVWKSTNTKIATITSSGVVKGKAPGKVTFTFTDSTPGCSSVTTSDSITIESCKNHDFNVAIVNQEIFGNLSTNDNFPVVASYSSSPQLISKPVASIVTFIINSDGSYSFKGNKPGNYRYRVPVCLDPFYSGCPTTLIEVTLVDNQYSTGNPVTNLDIATLFGVEGANKGSSLGGTFPINSIQNDVCIYTAGCDMDWSSAWIATNGSNGLAEIVANGVIEYTPDAGFIGFDTIYYGMCADGYSKCNTTMQIMTVNHSTAENSVIASDDFTFTLRGSSITGNVLTNDSDAEGDSIIVTPQGSLVSPIVTSAGEYYIDALGNFNFTPNDAFSGHTEIIYQICDNNVNQACMQATQHLLVFDDISVKLRVYLQGALMQNGGATSATGLPLMRDDLRVSPFTGENYIPVDDPYSVSADPFAGTPAQFNKIGPGTLQENKEIADSLGVFSVSGDNAIVDWVHVELRSKDNMAIPIATRSGLLQRDGDVVDLDGVSDLRYNGINVDSFYLVVKHRSHLGVMSQKVAYSDVVDFTSPTFPVYNFGVQGLNDFTGLSQNNNVVNGYSACWAGDFDSNGLIKFTNPGDDQNVLFVDVLFSSPDFLINFDQAYGYLTGDFNMNSKTKYTNPSDDINYLFSQILLYPLNSSFLSNYNSLIEQVPDDE
jgi:uncharacterized repeat protein (TIGR01451 family)